MGKRNKLSTIILFLTSTLLVIGQGQSLFAQAKYTLSGYVTDSVSGEVLNGGSIRVLGGTEGEVTNSYGYYAIRLPQGTYTVQYSFIGYVSKTVKISLAQSIQKDIGLTERPVQRKEIVITDKRESENVTKTEMGQIQLQMKRIEKLPVLFGEVDVLKTLQMLPGVQSGGEGTLGLYIRGGTPG